MEEENKKIGRQYKHPHHVLLVIRIPIIINVKARKIIIIDNFVQNHEVY